VVAKKSLKNSDFNWNGRGGGGNPGEKGREVPREVGEEEHEGGFPMRREAEGTGENYATSHN